jgi:hypothetical protein
MKSNSVLKPNAKYDHAYEIVRIDDNNEVYTIGNKEYTNPGVTVTKILWDFEIAEKEVERLNKGLNRYILQITRVEKQK